MQPKFIRQGCIIDSQFISTDPTSSYSRRLRWHHRLQHSQQSFQPHRLPILYHSTTIRLCNLEPLLDKLTNIRSPLNNRAATMSVQATRRLTRDYMKLQNQPEEFIVAHPSESNILEWHYILTGPPETPYAGGQYWGTLQFPPDYPFAPPAIRMHTPSGRFQPSSRLCLSISDFHPKSFNPAWEVRTILIGLMSFMTSEEMTTGSVRATERERKIFAARSRWWNSTGGGTTTRTIPGVSCGLAAQQRPGSTATGVGAIKAGDGGAKFKFEWAEIDAENWKHMEEQRIDPQTGSIVSLSAASGSSNGKASCAPGADALRKAAVNSAQGVVMEGAQNARNAGQGWLVRNKYLVVGAVFFAYVVVARMMNDHGRDFPEL
jgi:ubiquitin-conjugating enzyme E2 J2